MSFLKNAEDVTALPKCLNGLLGRTPDIRASVVVLQKKAVSPIKSILLDEVVWVKTKSLCAV